MKELKKTDITMKRNFQAINFKFILQVHVNLVITDSIYQ